MESKEEKLKALQLEKLELEKAQIELTRSELPHLYGFPWYPWAREHFESRNKINILCAGNQISKSSTQIRKAIHWATATDLWPELWPDNPRPRQFWYLYPSKDVSTAEFETKWEPEFMPRGSMKEDDQYGWEAVYKAGFLHHVRFNSGVRIYFKHYSQDVQKLQSGTVHCFPKGTLVATNRGQIAIEKLSEFDLVLTRNGFRKIEVFGKREKALVKKAELNGNSIWSTLEHPFWTNNRGWCEFGTLQAGDYLLQLPAWNLIKKLHYLKGYFTQEIQNHQTLGKETILGLDLENNSIYQYGKVITKLSYHLVMLFIMQIITPLIIGLEIFFAGQSKNILSITSSKNGRRKSLRTLPVNGAEKISFQDLQKEQFQDTVVKGVGEKLIELLALQKLVRYVMSPLQHRKIKKIKSSAQGNAQTERTVYNIQVEETNEFFANGILVHNCIFTDEELPVDLFDELSFRVDAVNGYFGMVFTATLGQNHWYKAIERMGKKDEVLKDAFKQQVSRWDCLHYEDKSRHIPTPWTPEKIKRAEAKCSTENERLKRIEGRFVMDEGLKYAAFQRSRNLVDPRLPIVNSNNESYTSYFDMIKREKWYIYSGTDIGSGGKSGHPAASAFIAVRPDFQKGAVFKGWKSPKNQDITSTDILKKYQELRGNMKTICAYYDWAASDFKVHANRLGESFEKAEKGHDIGEDTINSLFKHKMLDIFDIEELEDLPWELETLLKDTPKKNAKDDYIDAVRYGVTKIPWDWTACGEEFSEYKEPKKELTPDAQEIETRRTIHHQTETFDDGIEDEISYYNDLYEG